MTFYSQTSYDQIPYTSNPFVQSHPNRLATLGRMFGLAPALVTRCRVLELGCASGGNLLPMACHLPDSQFVGVDLSGQQIEQGVKTIAGLGLNNIHLAHGSILDVEADSGSFDYIICHGVFSWVEDAVQEKILEICGQSLAKDGIAYISYNTYPGWHMREMIRHMMLYHGGQFDNPKDQIEQARAMLEFLGKSVPEKGNYFGLMLHDELQKIKNSRDDYLFHDHLETVNTPLYFHQFAERAQNHGLEYLSEANFSSVLTTDFPDEITSVLDGIGTDIIRREQYMDFVKNRFFRQTLLCKKNLPIKRSVGGEDVTRLLAASDLTPQGDVNLEAGVKQGFATTQGFSIETDASLTKAALGILGDAWPRALDMDFLCCRALDRLGDNMDIETPAFMKKRTDLCDDLLHCYGAGVLEFHTWQADFTTKINQKPVAAPLARYMAGKKNTVVNQRHGTVSLDDVSRNLLVLMDGTRDVNALADHFTGSRDDFNAMLMDLARSALLVG